MSLMQTLDHPRGIVTFEYGVLWIKFDNGIEVDVKDVKEIYSFALKCSGGKDFAVLYDTDGTEDLKEDVVIYVAQNPDNFPIKAKAYIVDGEKIHKLKLHVAFDHPKIKPAVFQSKAEAMIWLAKELEKAE
jgi:hypothetical protein